MSTSVGNPVSSSMDGEPDYTQSTLNDWGMNLSRVPQWINSENSRLNNAEIYVTGDLMETEIFEKPNYDRLEFVIAEDENLNSGTLRDTPESRQEIESFLIEEDDCEAFNQVAYALENPERSNIWKEFGERGIPLNSDFYFQGSIFRINKTREVDASETVYPVPDYLAREKRPSAGVQTGLRSLRDNIAEEDKKPLQNLLSVLKETGATTYITGSILQTSQYNDIDIAVDGLARPDQTARNRTEGGVYQQQGSEYEGLPKRMAYSRSRLERTLEDLDNLEIVSKKPREDTMAEPWGNGYNALRDLYRLRMQGTQFDVGYNQEPFAQTNFLVSDDEPIEYAKV